MCPKSNTQNKILKFLFRLFVFLFIVDRLVGQAIAQNSQASQNSLRSQESMQTNTNSSHLPYPWDVNELQQKLIGVLKIDADKLSKENIEELFNLKLKRNPELLDSKLKSLYPALSSNPEKWYALQAEMDMDWYFQVGLVVLPDKTTFVFNLVKLEQVFKPENLPFCIDRDAFAKKIVSADLGWQLAASRPWLAHDGVVLRDASFSKIGNSDDRLLLLVPANSHCVVSLGLQITTNDRTK